MRILVCGGRDFTDKEFIYKHLNEDFGPHSDGDNYRTDQTTIITGGASGVDTIAHEWAKEVGCKTEVYPADWEKYGKAAGPIRNKQMLDEGRPDRVVCFPGGCGTQNMYNLAVKYYIPITICSRPLDTEWRINQ